MNKHYCEYDLDLDEPCGCVARFTSREVPGLEDVITVHWLCAEHYDAMCKWADGTEVASGEGKGVGGDHQTQTASARQDVNLCHRCEYPNDSEFGSATQTLCGRPAPRQWTNDQWFCADHYEFLMDVLLTQKE